MIAHHIPFLNEASRAQGWLQGGYTDMGWRLEIFLRSLAILVDIRVELRRATIPWFGAFWGRVEQEEMKKIPQVTD